jgi:hypothetical protein
MPCLEAYEFIDVGPHAVFAYFGYGRGHSSVDSRDASGMRRMVAGKQGKEGCNKQSKRGKSSFHYS